MVDARASLSESQERARKVHRPYAEGDLVKVAGGRNQAEAELIQGFLLEEGIPSLLRRTAGFDVPDMLAAGPRDVMVPEGGAQAAREALLQAELLPSASATNAAVSPGRLLLWLLVAVAVVALVVVLASALGA